jgi:Spy/CpxP family protein refolding chaperone
MKSMFKPLLIAGLLATAGLAAFSQSQMDAGMGHERMDKGGHMNPARMQAHIDKKNAALKAKLKLTAAQDADWAKYVAAIKPPADMQARQAQHAELGKLPTPERIDKMKTLHSQHMTEMTAAMDKRGEATKTFYATLTPEQKKAFDSATMSRHDDKGHMGGMGAGKGPAPAKP